jgi:adenosine deaminase CECR1
MGVKSIKETIEKNLVCAFQISKEYPKIEVGYDLVDNEDKYLNQWTLKDILIKRYKELKEEYGSDVHYVFHAGESNNVKNTNILDCILLGTKRIGHGLMLFKQQYLMDEVKRRGIVVEINMLSNLVMKY